MTLTAARDRALRMIEPRNPTDHERDVATHLAPLAADAIAACGAW